MPVVGAFARVETDPPDAVRQRLADLEGVETFGLGDPGKIGLIIEGDDLDAVHAILTQRVRSVDGVLGAWPVSVHLDDELQDDGSDAPSPEENARSAR